MSRKSPQEKKALSYARDRRNTYGENDKSSRKNIARNKRVPNRADRRRETQQLATATGPLSLDAAAVADLSLTTTMSMWVTRSWRKSPDTPLGEVVTWRLTRRVEKGMNTPAATSARVARVARNR
ncbi:hypothetical protein ACWIGI_23955 [Nocardia sp. NPDC055321]